MSLHLIEWNWKYITSEQAAMGTMNKEYLEFHRDRILLGTFPAVPASGLQTVPGEMARVQGRVETCCAVTDCAAYLQHNHGGSMNTFKTVMHSFITGILLLGITGAAAQQNEKNIAKNAASRLADKLEFGFSETYDIVNAESMYIDIDLKKMSATLCFSSHPVYTFAAELIDYESDAASISGRYVELTGNGTARFYIDRAGKKVYVKTPGSGGGIKKIVYGRVTIERTASKKERIGFTGTAHMSFILHNTGGGARADFYLKEGFMFSLNAEPLTVDNIQNPFVWNLRGNTHDVLSVNTSKNILYFREKDPKITWARIVQSQDN